MTATLPDETDRVAALARLVDPETVVVFDGAMGTMLYARGVFINQCYDELNLRAPSMIAEVHAEYVAAGAEVLETNSFGANRAKLAQYGLEAEVGTINRAAARLAREAADAARGRTVLVAGAVGPLGLRIEPLGPTSREEARAMFREQLSALREGGADCFILETFGDLHEMEEAIRAAREVAPEAPVIAQMTVGTDGVTPLGAVVEDVVRALDAAGADVVGLNCSVGPQTILEAIERMAPLTKRKLSAMPNAGMPRDVGGRSMYMASPEYMASYARHLVHAGARVVGGCCGTTPAHVRAMSSALRAEKAMARGGSAAALPNATAPDAGVPNATAPNAGVPGAGVPHAAAGGGGGSAAAVDPIEGAAAPPPNTTWSDPPADASPESRGAGRRVAGISGVVDRATAHRGPHGLEDAPGVAPVALGERSRLGAKLARGEFVTSVEIVPPRGVNAERMLEDVRALAAAGVDAVNVPDGPRAQSRMSAVLVSILIQQNAPIEAVTHYCCRDRNLLGMLSDLLGASAMGLRNLLLITGDPPKMGPYPDATAVFDIDSIGLTNMTAQLNRGLDPGGNAIGEPTRFTIGVGVNPAAIDPATELARFEYKVEAGAEYAITQPVFDADQLERFLGTVEHTRIPIVAGIWPLVSARNAEFLANEVPGVTVPEPVLARMRAASAKSKEHAVAEGVAIAREMMERVRGSVQGAQVSAPFGRVGLALEVFG